MEVRRMGGAGMVLATLLSLSSGGAFAQAGEQLRPSVDALMAYAKANAGRFSSEAKVVGKLQPGTVITVRLRVREFVDYDDQQQEAELGVSDLERTVTLKCSGAGSFTGQNAFGAQAQVTRQRCDKLDLEDENFGRWPITAKVSMTAAQFRRIRDSGYDLELDFELGPKNAKGALVDIERIKTAATVHSPREYDTNWIRVHGAAKAIRWYRPGETDAAGEFLAERDLTR